MSATLSIEVCYALPNEQTLITVALPEGVRPTVTDRDFVVATVTGRMAEVEEVTPEAAAAAPAAEAPEAPEIQAAPSAPGVPARH